MDNLQLFCSGQEVEEKKITFHSLHRSRMNGFHTTNIILLYITYLNGICRKVQELFYSSLEVEDSFSLHSINHVCSGGGAEPGPDILSASVAADPGQCGADHQATDKHLLQPERL